jgi:hypothetical protein
MGCIRVEKIIDYLAGPLQKCLHDENPYVRKTAALCVAKLYDLKPELVLENGFLEQLHEMISDSNPMVRVVLLPPPFQSDVDTFLPRLLRTPSLRWQIFTRQRRRSRPLPRQIRPSSTSPLRY